MSTIEVRQATADDWQVQRDLRLAALRIDPGAFGSSYEREADFSEGQWRSRLERTDGALFIAAVADAAAGMVGVYVRTERQETVPELVSMWVAPAFRGAGVGRALVDAVLDWAAAEGHDEMRLMVADGNRTALAFYERLGFTLNDYSQPMPHADEIEHEMARHPAGT